MRARAAALTAAPMLALLLLAACDNGDRVESARKFPPADRPVAPTVSTKWSTEEARDRVREAEQIMDAAAVAPGMTVADIGAGDGYYTVRLAQRVGARGRVLAQDIQPKVIERLADRVARERLDNVSLKLGAVDDPRLPPNSFDRVFLVHMYHEIGEPYAFLWRLYPALRAGGEVIVVDSDRPTAQHGIPLRLLICEFETVGYRLVAFSEKKDVGAYFARFTRKDRRPEPEAMTACKGGQ